MQDLKDDESLKQDLEKLRRGRRTIRDNQSSGSEVEKLVGKILDKSDDSFHVESVHKGADFKITVTQGWRKWWIEVKSTREQSVKMSSDQTKVALDEKEKYLLCVVPIPENVNLETVVRKNMLFIKNIDEKLGERVATLCKSTKEQEAVLTNTPDDTSSGVKLDFEKGKVGIRVNHSVWEDEGFPLEDLIKHLK